MSIILDKNLSEGQNAKIRQPRKRVGGFGETICGIDQSSLVIVYGRRRVGKTALITEFLKRHSNSLYFLATEESEMQNLNYFKVQVAEFTGNELLKSASVDWLTVFKTLIDYKTETKKIIVLDEFQYIGQSNSAFPSVMQKVWDTRAQRRECYVDFVRLSRVAHEVANA